MMPPFLLFLLTVIGILLLSLVIEKTTLPQTFKSVAWAVAVIAIGLFLLYCGIIALGYLGLT